MPELPEVETVRAGLAPWLEGAKIKDVQIFQNKLRYDIPENFAKSLIGARIHHIRRRAKYLVFDFMSRGFIIHLGMSGSMRRIDTGEELRKHDHILFITDKAHVVYNDPRRFGAVDLWQDDFNAHKWLADIGPEPLGNAFNADILAEGLAKRSTPIKPTLLDQKLIAGIGNIYASEALWRAKIGPERASNTLKNKEIEALVISIRNVLQDAIASGGSTLKDHRQTNGELGYFQHKFDVYDREGEPCHANRCKATIEKIVQSTRATYFCPNCQKPK